MSANPAHQAELTTLAPQRVLSIRGTIPVAHLGDAMGERLGALAAALKQQALRANGPLIARYHTFDHHGETDVEHAVAVTQAGISSGPVTAAQWPGGDAVTVWHTGDHTTLGATYDRMRAKLGESGREPDGPPWEEFHWIDLNRFDTDAASWGSTALWRLRLVQPVK